MWSDNINGQSSLKKGESFKIPMVMAVVTLTLMVMGIVMCHQIRIMGDFHTPTLEKGKFDNTNGNGDGDGDGDREV